MKMNPFFPVIVCMVLIGNGKLRAQDSSLRWSQQKAWMNRPNGSVIANLLPVFYNEKVGCILWGLVNGKTQTDLPWGHRPGDPPPNLVATRSIQAGFLALSLTRN